MTKFLTLLLIPFLSTLAIAEDLAIKKQLETLGGKVTLKGDAVTAVEFRDSSQLKDVEWKAIGSLKHLEKITAYGGAKGLTDETVEHLLGLKNLESLNIDGGQLSDAGLAKLSKIQSLESVAFFHLSFRMDGFTGSGFTSWKNLPHLEKLTVAGMTMGDEGFAAISGIESLKELRTWHTHRTQASHELIAKLPNLTTLKLGQRLPHDKTPVCLDDSSLAVVAKMESLEALDIGEADFTVEGIAQLKALPNLKRLKIDRTFLKESDIESLRAKMPDVKIDFQPLKEDQRKKLEDYLK